MVYEQTKKKIVEAIVWTGQNMKEIKDFVPKDFARFEADRVTQLIHLTLIDYNSKMYYNPKWGDYIVHDVDENKYYAVSKQKFEEEFTDYNIVHPKSEVEEDNWKPFVNIQIVTVKPSMNTSGTNGYNVKDATGFIKFFTEEEFKKQFTSLENYISNDLEIQLKEKK